jgi:NADPH:quinone reductase-like Zn-dependent oxidoreductase
MTMRAVLLTGYGGLDKLEYRTDVPVPKPAADEVLIAVAACGVNNTDINTRTGWYAPDVRIGTTAELGLHGVARAAEIDGTWGGAALSFPRIQGADPAGVIVAVGADVEPSRIGERVIVDGWIRDPDDPADLDKTQYLGSERDGGFAEYVAVPARNAYRVECELSTTELASFQCSYATAEQMLTRTRVSAGETLLVTGASGGVGSALVQLARRRKARIVAVVSPDKAAAVRALGADFCIPRESSHLAAEVRSALGGGSVDVVTDVVGGRCFPDLIAVLRRGGRYVTSGAIAGPIAEVDLRLLYNKDLELHGSSVTWPETFARLVGYIERGEIKPLLVKTYALADIREAQREFLAKRHVGKLVVII